MSGRAQSTKRIPVELHDDTRRFMPMHEVTARTGFGKSTLRQLEQRKIFPRRLRLSACSVTYFAADVFRFINATAQHGGLPPPDWQAAMHGAANEPTNGS